MLTAERQTARRTARSAGWRIGLLGGLALAVALVTDGAHAVAPRDPAASLRVALAPTSTIEVNPTGALIDGAGLHGGSSVRADAELLNITGVPLNVGLRARSQDTGLDDVLHVEVQAGEMRVFRGVLGLLRRGSTRFQLAPGQLVTVSVEASLPRGVAGAGRSADVIIDLESDPEPGAS